MPSERVEFAGSKGARLAGRLDRPDGEAHATALFAHCFTCSKDVHAASRISRGLAERGFAVLRFDFTGLGHSDGEFAHTDFSSNVDDVEIAARWLGENEKAPSLLVGHSLGGAAVLAVASRLDSVRAVATVGAPSEPAHVAEHLGAARETIESEGVAEVRLAGRPFRIRREFIEDLEEQKLTSSLADLGRALMIFHAPLDDTVGIDHAARIYQAAKHPKSFVSLDGADHLLTDPDDSAFVADVLAVWVGRYL